MGIFKPQHLVPHGADLLLAIPPAFLDGGEVVYTFPGAEKRLLQLHRVKIFHRFPLPNVFRVENLVGGGIVYGFIVQGDAPDATYWFNCKSCGERFYLEDGELISPFDSSRQNSSRICSNCGQSLSGGEYTAPWENGNNSEGYVICPHCGYTNFEWDD